MPNSRLRCPRCFYTLRYTVNSRRGVFHRCKRCRHQYTDQSVGPWKHSRWGIEKSEKILKWIKKHPKASANEVAQKFGVTRDGIKLFKKKARAKGLLKENSKPEPILEESPSVDRGLEG